MMRYDSDLETQAYKDGYSTAKRPSQKPVRYSMSKRMLIIPVKKATGMMRITEKKKLKYPTLAELNKISGAKNTR